MTAWHADAESIGRYVNGTLGSVWSASLEAHLLSCASCRDAVGAACRLGPGRDVRHEAVWDDLVDAVDAPEPRLAERFLAAVGVPMHVARLLAANSSTRYSWTLSMVAALLFALAAAATDNDGLFLVVAPVLPLAAVAAAHPAALDRMTELVAASPVGRLRLLLMRTIATVASTMVLLAVASLAGGGGIEAVAWLLPALALAAASVAASTWVAPSRAASSMAVSWLALVFIATRPSVASARAFDRSLADFAAFDPGGQAVFAVLLAAAVAVIAFRSPVADRRSSL